MRSTTPSVLRAARNEALGYQATGPPFSTHTPSQIRRRPLSSAANVPTHIAPSQAQYEQYPVSVPNSDRNYANTADSMRDQSDSPSYQMAALGRRHIYPAMMMELANVPTARQDPQSSFNKFTGDDRCRSIWTRGVDGDAGDGSARKRHAGTGGRSELPPLVIVCLNRRRLVLS
jgi:hypothetical protein